MTLLLALPVLTLVAVVAAIASPTEGVRNPLAGAASVLLGLAGATIGIYGLTTGATVVDIDLAGLRLAFGPDRLGSFFLALIGVVGALCAWYGIGYAHGASASRTSWTAYPLFLAGMFTITVAGDAVTFLSGWEVMALASMVLVGTDHATRPSVRSALAWYAVLTHASFAAVLAGLAVLASAADGLRFTDITGAALHGPAATWGFLLVTLGCATKAGLVPLHVWLPKAHPEAPSHVSAAMSAAMVKVGVYGQLVLVLRLLPDGPTWWGALLLALGLASALYGILQAGVTSDLKRLLGFSTTENTGLIVAAVGAAHLAFASGRIDAGSTALLAALLLALAHASFKTALFLAAGSYLSAGVGRDLDGMGGLAQRMPWTSGALAVGAMGAAALPVASGFVAEWTLLQALVHGASPDDRLSSTLLPVAVAIVALVAGLALLTFVKVVGIAALARPRSAGADQAQEVGFAQRSATVVAAAFVLVLGLLPGATVSWASFALGVLPHEGTGPFTLTLPALNAGLTPAALLALVLLGVGIVTVGSPIARRRRPRRITDLPWGCGGVRLDPRMQYTATSFAEPVMRVFDDALRPNRDLSVVPAAESAHIIRSVAYRQEVTDQLERLLYRPILRGLNRLGDAGRAVHNGNLSRYLGFMLATLLVALLVVTR